MKRIHIGLIWLIIAIVGIILSFYWFSVRPENIRKNCYISSVKYYGSVNYEACLIEHGL